MDISVGRVGCVDRERWVLRRRQQGLVKKVNELINLCGFVDFLHRPCCRHLVILCLLEVSFAILANFTFSIRIISFPLSLFHFIYVVGV
ncbi:hypothetical protein LINPERHAP2_LOCUS24445 [Linum perenne]